jgi:hypothetical protein
MKRIVVVSVSGVLAVAIGVLGTRIYERRSHPTAHTDQSAAANADLEALRQEIASLRASQRVLAEATWSRLTAARAPVEPAPAAAPSPPTPAQHGSESAPTEARPDPVLQAFEREAPDPGWATLARAKLVEKFSGKDFSGVHLDAECKTTICRVAFAFDSTAEPERSMPLVGASIPWEGTASGTFDPESHRGVYYFSRPGHALPLPPIAGSAAAN